MWIVIPPISSYHQKWEKNLGDTNCFHSFWYELFTLIFDKIYLIIPTVLQLFDRHRIECINLPLLSSLWSIGNLVHKFGILIHFLKLVWFEFHSFFLFLRRSKTIYDSCGDLDLELWTLYSLYRKNFNGCQVIIYALSKINKMWSPMPFQ